MLVNSCGLVSKKSRLRDFKEQYIYGCFFQIITKAASHNRLFLCVWPLPFLSAGRLLASRISWKIWSGRTTS